MLSNLWKILVMLYKHPQRVKAIIEKHPIYFFIVIGSIVVLLWVVAAIIFLFKENLDSLASAGDSFGSLNTLFSGLAFAGLIMTIVLQSIELRAQRKELRNQRKELKGQKIELEIQNKTAELQRFDASFFNLLSGFRECRDRIYLNSNTIGSMAINSVWIKMSRGSIRNSDIKALYHYFFYIYRILKFIDEYVFYYADNLKIRQNYIDILMSNLSLKEFTLLYYNSLNFEEMKLLVEKYHIWGSMFPHGKQDLTVGDIIFFSKDRELYDDTAFRANPDTDTTSDNTIK